MNRHKFIFERASFDKERFYAPDTMYYPVYSWVWNDALSKEEIEKQIEQMRDGGIKAFYIIPEPPMFRPTSMITRMDTGYLSDEFFEYMDYALKLGKSCGMDVWIYDEGGWPSGNACSLTVKNSPQYKQKILKKVTDDGIEKYEVSIKSDFSADMFEKGAVDNFIKITYDGYRRISMFPECRCVFTDEPIAPTPAAPTEISERWKQKHTDDIEDIFPLLFKEDLTEEESRKVIDYRMMLGEIFNKNYFENISQWCKKNNILFAGHIDRDDDLHNIADRGYGNALTILRNFDIPGVDLIANQINPYTENNEDATPFPFFARMASSAAHLNQTTYSLSEIFAVYGAGITHNLMRYITNFHLCRGINILNPMLISYGRKDFLAYTERPSFSPEMPLYRALKQYNIETARLCYLMSVGEPVVKTALFYPVHEILRGGEYGDKICRDFYALGSALEKNGIDFDIIDANVIKAGNAADGKLIYNGIEYQSVVSCNLKYTPINIREKLGRINNNPLPLWKSSSGYNDIRMRMRATNNERICLFFNESSTPKETNVEINDLRDTYILHRQSGKIFRYLSDVNNDARCFNIKLNSGEAAVIIFTDENLSDEIYPLQRRLINSFEINDKVMAKVSQFIIDKGGMKKIYFEKKDYLPASLMWKDIFGQSFSGEVSYKTFLNLKQIEGEYALINVNHIEYIAQVFVNNKSVGFVFDNSSLVTDSNNFVAGKNEIELIVANTEANEIVCSENDKIWSDAELGTYHYRAKRYESQFLGGGLDGSITVKFV